MSRRTLKSLSLLVFGVVSIAVILAWTIAWAVALNEKKRAVERTAEELQVILADLWERKDEKTWGRAWESFNDWMARNVVRGQTTRAQVLTWFGTEHRDLDRPERDEVQTITYTLFGDWSDGSYLVFDFDPRTGILQDWHTYNAICGFCPHVEAYDGRWRLEGKMLAGRIDPSREGPDTLLLPRLVLHDRKLRICLANWAPETEYLDQVQLGMVPCQRDCEVDVDGDGQIYVWKEACKIEMEPLREGNGSDEWALALGEPVSGRALVLEARNTGEFETAMCRAVFTPCATWPSAELNLHFDDGTRQQLQPVGTKFLRRIVVAVPPSAQTVKIGAPGSMWLVRRAWLGQGRLAQDVTWLSASQASGDEADALRLLRARDRHRLVLRPGQEVYLGFVAPLTGAEHSHHRFVLRMWGYYEFLARCTERTPGQ
jgi:hypothetical protein